MKLKFTAAAIVSSLIMSGCSSSSDNNSDFDHNLSNMQKVLNNNANIAYAAYSDSVTTAEALQAAIVQFKTDSADGTTEMELQAVKDAWLVAREPYGQTEVYRFRSSPIDDDPTTAAEEDGPEGAVNAWPLGEALIDYVKTNNTDFGNDQIGTTHDVTNLTAGTITVISASDESDNIIGNNSIDLSAASTLLDKSEAIDGRDVISGYHAIEFMLWGQDLKNDGTTTAGTDRDFAIKTNNAPSPATGGDRPATDFDLRVTFCTTGTSNNAAPDTIPCTRRHDFMKLVADKLVADLTAVRDQWAPNGAYRASFTGVTTVDQAKAKMLEILTGMGTLAVGELAGERMQIAFAANSQEDEHSCFSDNTHRDIVLNALGVENAYYGSYGGYDSSLNGTADVTTNAVDGYGIDDYLTEQGATDLATAVQAALTTTKTNYTSIDTMARDGTPVDVQIMTPISNNDAMAQTILALNAEGEQFAQIISDLQLGETSLDDFEDTACDTSNPTATSDECGQ